MSASSPSGELEGGLKLWRWVAVQYNWNEDVRFSFWLCFVRRAGSNRLCLLEACAVAYLCMQRTDK